MSILLHTPWMTKNFGKKERIKMKLGRIVVISVITIYVAVTVLGLAINPETFS